MGGWREKVRVFGEKERVVGERGSERGVLEKLRIGRCVEMRGICE